MKIKVWNHFKLNKINGIITVIIIGITITFTVLALVFDNDYLTVVSTYLYFPAVLFMLYLMDFSIFKTCSPSFGGDACIQHTTIPFILSIPIYIFCVYITSCLIYYTWKKITKRNFIRNSS